MHNPHNALVMVSKCHVLRYHDLQPVIMRPSEDSGHGSSSSSVIASSLINGLESQHMHTDHTSRMMGEIDGSSSDTLIETG